MESTHTYTSGLSAKGALLEETLLILRHLEQGLTVPQVRAMVVENDLLGKNTVATRESIWERVRARYLDDEDRARIVSRMVTNAPDRQTEKLVLLYEFCRTTPLLRDITLECIYPHYAAGYVGVDKALVQQYLDDVSAAHPEITEWSPQTRGKVVSNALSILRDFGLLVGTQRKQFARLYVPLAAFVYVLYSLREEGITTPTDVMAAQDWRIFLLDEEDVLTLLDEASAATHCTFKHQVDIYALDFSYPSLAACVKALTGL